jgi:hypothetical protein
MKKFLSIITGLVFSLTAQADLYNISDIPIKAELASAREARSVAIANGQIDAFWALMQKLILPEDLQRVPFLEQDAVANLVQNVSLTDEKTTATRYMATLAVRFYPDRIQTFLTEAQIPFLQRAFPPTLIIPVFEKDDETLLLTDNNPIYNYLKENPLSENTSETLIPLGDLEEITLAQSAWENQDNTAFLSLAEKYDASQILLFIVKQKGPYINVIIKTFSDKIAQPVEALFEFTDPLGNLTALMPQIAQEVWKQQQEDWRQANTNDLQTPLIYWIRIPITHLKQWHTIQTKLEQTDFLNQFEIRAFRKDEVFLLIRFKGTSDMLNEKLQKSGLQLTISDIDGLWDLTEYKGDTP